jgi:predicted metal-dependent peptidase
MAQSKARPNPATEAYEAGKALLWAHPVFAPLSDRVALIRSTTAAASPPTGWLLVQRDGHIYAHPKRSATAQEWAFVLARGVLCLAMEFFQKDRANWLAWCAACDVVTTRFLLAIKIGQMPDDMQLPDDLPGWDEPRWYESFCAQGAPDWVSHLSLAGVGSVSMQLPEVWTDPVRTHWTRKTWAELFAKGIADSVTQAVEVAAGARPALGGKPIKLRSATERARSWFSSSFPLLGAMISAFEILEDVELCRREEIMVGAVSESQRLIYLNPAAGLNGMETRFVLAHEVLHVALRHMSRRQGRDAYLWNVACDYVINEWLIEMRVGQPPAMGLLHDAQLKGLSAEELYDRIVGDMRRMRKLLTLAGRQGDMLDRRLSPEKGDFTDLDAFYKNQLGKGLLLHESQGRGLLPAGLLEEIRALLQPPISWEVELARWFDHHFPPVESVRSYARMSRRQSATPDIPRPRAVPDPRWLDGRTFGVMLDTSGSMDRHLLAKALGAIASYAQAKEVPAVRVVFCDATAYDAGYMMAEDIAYRVEVKGRGGTVLQPAIDLLQSATDFPKDGPLLIITDGQCEKLSCQRSHAFLLPAGKRLPFSTLADVFYLS